jgi:hypothetical protein
MARLIAIAGSSFCAVVIARSLRVTTDCASGAVSRFTTRLYALATVRYGC